MCFLSYRHRSHFFSNWQYTVYTVLLSSFFFLKKKGILKHFQYQYIYHKMIISKNFIVFHTMVPWFIELMPLLLNIYSTCSNKNKWNRKRAPIFPMRRLGKKNKWFWLIWFYLLRCSAMVSHENWFHFLIWINNSEEYVCAIRLCIEVQFLMEVSKNWDCWVKVHGDFEDLAQLLLKFTSFNVSVQSI